jgi:hypothetical protein
MPPARAPTLSTAMVERGETPSGRSSDFGCGHLVSHHVAVLTINSAEHASCSGVSSNEKVWKKSIRTILIYSLIRQHRNSLWYR